MINIGSGLALLGVVSGSLRPLWLPAWDCDPPQHCKLRPSAGILVLPLDPRLVSRLDPPGLFPFPIPTCFLLPFSKTALLGP